MMLCSYYLCSIQVCRRCSRQLIYSNSQARDAWLELALGTITRVPGQQSARQSMRERTHVHARACMYTSHHINSSSCHGNLEHPMTGSFLFSLCPLLCLSACRASTRNGQASGAGPGIVELAVTKLDGCKWSMGQPRMRCGGDAMVSPFFSAVSDFESCCRSEM